VQSTTNDAGAGAATAREASLALVFINSDAGEGYRKVENVKQGDRADLHPWHGGDALVEAVARTGVPTVVVVHSVGPVLLERILAQKNVRGIVWAGLPGQESGNALADVLFGDVAPSGKLPYTIGKREEDYGVQVAMGNVSEFVERSYIDYRWFDARGIAPRYEFGFGLCKSAPAPLSGEQI
jgi:beta-glucosidase